MISRLIGRGLLAGAAAGLCLYVFMITLIEPVIDKAIAYEGVLDGAHEAMAHSHAHEEGGEIFSRSFQSYVGSGVAIGLYALAMGVLVAVAYIVASGRVGNLRARTLGLLIPAFGFIGIFAVPFIKYPATPPAASNSDTIQSRGASFLILVAASCILLFLAVYVGQKVAKRTSAWNASVIVGVVYLAVMVAIMLLLPSFHDETPGPILDASGKMLAEGYPANVLSDFRIYAIGAQVILWSVIGLVFAPLAAKVVEGQAQTELV